VRADAHGPLTRDPVETVDAATVVLVRDATAAGGAPLEVLLLERHRDVAFAGGALVFPGGRVEDADRELDASRWTAASSLATWCERLGTADQRDALGLLVAAVRETFEEAGVLLARREDGRPLDADDLDRDGVVAARRRLVDRERRWDWRDWLEDEGLVLDLGALALWSWWVTPEGPRKRFDTRFLVARMPVGQVATPDGVETTGLRWGPPDAPLAARDRGEVTVIFPTRRNLAAMSRHADADAAWHAAARGDVDQRRILPTLVRTDAGVLVQHPDGGPPEPV
jgi:8-oxo-dGTP pyrophosphatase MutT (NUDIX family)